MACVGGKEGGVLGVMNEAKQREINIELRQSPNHSLYTARFFCLELIRAATYICLFLVSDIVCYVQCVCKFQADVG